MREKGKIETMRHVTKAEGESERVGSEIVVSVYTKVIIRTRNQCRWLSTTSHLASTSVNNCYMKKSH